VLFRSADLQELGDPGVATLQQLGVTHVFDLRSAKELKELEEKGKQPARTWEGATRIFVPVFLDVDYSPEAIALRFGNYSDGPQVS
jgi:protein tyrosine/serine phosphatase